MDTFIFKGYEKDLATGKVEFSYTIARGGKDLLLKETLEFIPISNPIPESLLRKTLDNLHLILGISYWKLYCPKEIQTPNITLTKRQAEFWNIIYTKGLGEFYYKNKIDYRNLVSFPFTEAHEVKSISFPRTDKALAGIGGGKDSIVTAKLLLAAGKDFSGFILNPVPLQEQVTEKLGIEALSMQRTLDPLLFELNKKKDAYNGHVPVSTIYAFCALFAAILYDFKYIIVSNEKSSSYGNVEYLGLEINHQWSKSFELEKLFQSYTKTFITPDITYFSSLRGFSELQITEMFTKYPDFFSIFSSCNTNFKQNAKNNKLWCGKCPKCAFVFSQLAAFLPKETITSIFGENLFEKENLIITYKELLGIKDIKPFDCVGTPDEVKLAFYKVRSKGEYRDDKAMRMFETEVLPHIENPENLEKTVFSSSKTAIPEEFKKTFNT